MSLATDLADYIEIVSNNVANFVLLAIEALTDDFEPFGWSELTEDEQLMEYANIRNSPDAMYKYMDGKAQGLIQRFKEGGLDDEKIASLHPYQIAIVTSLNNLYALEQAYQKRFGNAV